MQPDKAATVRGWLSKAANDLRGARIDLEADPPLIEDALFHCQQAAEKSLKALLTSHDSSFKKTHDLDELGSACLALDAGLSESLLSFPPSRSSHGSSATLATPKCRPCTKRVSISTSRIGSTLRFLLDFRRPVIRNKSIIIPHTRSLKSRSVLTRC